MVHWTQLESRTQAQWCEYLRRFVDYCWHCAEHEPRFVPEAEAGALIRALFEAGGLDRANVASAVRIVNRVATTEHYNGSGWFNLRWRLVYACADVGIAVRQDPHGGVPPDGSITLADEDHG